MDRNIDFKNLINSITKIGENDTFFKDMIGLNDSFIRNEEMEECVENRMPCLNVTAVSERQEVNETNFSFQLMSDQEMDFKLTPSLDLKTNVNKRNNLFAFHNKRQLFGNNFCDNHQNSESKDKIEVKDNEWENTLGLSPLKNNSIKDDISSSINVSQKNKFNDFEDLSGIQINNFSSNSQQLGMQSLLEGQSFKSVSKCSDLDLRAEEPKVDINETYRSPNSNFDNKSISAYFIQHSESIPSIKSMNISIEPRISSSGSGFSVLDESFASVFNEMDSSNNTLEIAQKIIDRKQRKRKSDLSRKGTASLNSAQDFESETSFSPDLNSTHNSSEDMSDKNSMNPMRYKSVSTSGLGTMTTLGQTYSMPNSNKGSFNCLMTGNALTLNQLLIISPNVLSLTMGCFVDFKLNYLKVRNLSITSFKAEMKLQTDADTLNSIDIQFPKQAINIPAFFDGLLSDQIIITPLKSGSFTITFQIYICIEGINLPISPMSVICHIRSEEIVIKRPLYLSDCIEFSYNLFEDNMEFQTIELCVSNRQIMNEIPLKLCLEPNKQIVFEPTHRHPESVIHTFRCSDPNTLCLLTKTQYRMKIPIRIQWFGIQKTESCLTVSTDSRKGHVLALFRLVATFWPKRQLKGPLLQCSHTSIILKANKWKAIHFRNKSKENLIRINIKCSENWIKLSSNQVMIPPLQKSSFCLMFESKNTTIGKNSNVNLFAEYDSGLGKTMTISIPIQTISL